MGTGSSQFIQVIEARPLSPPDLILTCTNSLAWYLGFVVRPALSRDCGTRFAEYFFRHTTTLMMYLSTTLQQYWLHLQKIFQRLREAGITIRGCKCCVNMSKVMYLSHIFSDKRIPTMTRKLQQCGTGHILQCG